MLRSFSLVKGCELARDLKFAQESCDFPPKTTASRKFSDRENDPRRFSLGGGNILKRRGKLYAATPTLCPQQMAAFGMKKGIPVTIRQKSGQ
tara:strand:+ start:4149 stop:4424 length:276 start_codon:yes stop_codon:yes gene_type:complete